MQGLNTFGLVGALVRNANARLVKKPGDYVNGDGLLVCGACHTRKQDIIEVEDTTQGGQNHTRKIVVRVLCECEQERERREREAKKAEEDMEKIQKLRNASLTDTEFATFTFDSFQRTKYNEMNLKLCRRYAQKFDEMLEKNQGLIFWGDVGTGKSYAAACIANELFSKRIPVFITSLVKLLEVIQGGEDKESDIIARMNRAKLVIFDDLGAERSTDYGLEKVYNVIDSRHRARLPMILTTNLTLEEMQKEDDVRYKRIYDRIFETCYPMQFTGPSFRKIEAFRRFDEIEKLLKEN